MDWAQQWPADKPACVDGSEPNSFLSSSRRSKMRPHDFNDSTMPSAFVLSVFIIVCMSTLRIRLRSGISISRRLSSLAGIDCWCSFHILYSLKNHIIRNIMTAFNIIREMSKNRMKQLNRGCNARSGIICFVPAVIDGVSDLGLCVHRRFCWISRSCRFQNAGDKSFKSC